MDQPNKNQVAWRKWLFTATKAAWCKLFYTYLHNYLFSFVIFVILIIQREFEILYRNVYFGDFLKIETRKIVSIFE